MDAPDWPDPDTLRALVECLADNPAAHAEFARAVYLPLLRDLQAGAPTDDPARVLDVVGDLVLAFVKRPDRYDPARLPVRNYLLMAARADLSNARAREGRRKALEIPLESVAEPPAGGNEEDEDDVRDCLADPRIAAVINGFDAVERAVWELMLTGDRTTTACATVLGVGGRPVADQEREVKRVKDRIKARLRRARETA